MVKLPAGVELPAISLERKYRSVVAGLTARIKEIYDAIYDRFGEEGLQLIADVSADYGREIANRAGQRVKSDDVKSTALFLLHIFDLASYKSEPDVTEFSDERVVIRVDQCPYPFERPEICAAHTTMEIALVNALSPNLDYHIGRCIPAGDRYCEHIICKKPNH